MLSRQRVWSDPGMMTPGVPGSGGNAFPFHPEGCIWSSSPNLSQGGIGKGGGPHCRVAPGGQILEIILPTPGKSAIACCLGGPDGKTLFLLEADMKKGQIRTIQVEVGAAKDP